MSEDKTSESRVRKAVKEVIYCHVECSAQKSCRHMSCIDALESALAAWPETEKREVERVTVGTALVGNAYRLDPQYHWSNPNVTIQKGDRWVLERPPPPPKPKDKRIELAEWMEEVAKEAEGTWADPWSETMPPKLREAAAELRRAAGEGT